jgi:RsiW-degrading membrane proteinase PrsW (M82 family)
MSVPPPVTGGWPAPRRGPGAAPVPAANPAWHHHALMRPPQAPRGRGLGWLALALAAVAAVAALVLVTLVVGPRAAVMGGILALFPLTLVLLTIGWLDRWEPEPRGALWFALLWGAGVSVLAALVLNQLGADYFLERTADPDLALQLTASYVAPVVEESAKGLGVLLIFLVRRRYFDGPVDGVVYAATVAAGFAFVENVLYFGQAAEGLATVFVMRAVAAPFAHVLFTSCVGIALGIASRRRSGLAVVVAFPLGLAAAVSLHALWNVSTTLGATFLALYVLVQVPLFLLAAALAVWLGRQESEVVRRRLTEYATSGWFLPAEVEMLSSLPQRRQAVAWAARYGPHARAAMRAFQRQATDLAYFRQRALTGRAELGRPADEAELLAELSRARAAFAAAQLGV